MRPLRLKSSSTPASAANFQGLQEMTDAEINQYLSYTITNKFAADTDGSGTAELNVDTANALGGTSIGTFIDSKRVDAIGTHPTAGASTTTTYYFKQVETVASESITNRPLGNDATGINKFSDAELDTDIIDIAIDNMVNETAYTVGQYALSVTTPVDAGTWTERYTITNTFQDSGSNSIKLWQKTAPNSAADSNLAPLKVFNTSDIKVMTAAEIEQLVPNFRNRIIASGIGTYKIQTAAPGTGTWVQQGDAAGFTDTMQEVAPVAYAGEYAGTFDGDYVGTYIRYYAGYSGAFNSIGYSGAFGGPGPGFYSGIYTGFYTGGYTGEYTGETIAVFDLDVSTVKLWLRTA